MVKPRTLEKGCRSCTFQCEGEGVYTDINDRSPRHAKRARDAPLYIARKIFWEEEPQALKQTGRVTTRPVANLALRRRYGAPRATAFEPSGKGIAIHFHKWCCGRCRGKTIQAEKLRAQLQCSRSGRQVCQKAVMRKRAAEKTVALFRCPTHPVPPVRLKRRRFFVIVYRY